MIKSAEAAEELAAPELLLLPLPAESTQPQELSAQAAHSGINKVFENEIFIAIRRFFVLLFLCCSFAHIDGLVNRYLAIAMKNKGFPLQ